MDRFEKQCTESANGDPLRTGVLKEDRRELITNVTIADINQIVITFNGKRDYCRLFELELE